MYILCSSLIKSHTAQTLNTFKGTLLLTCTANNLRTEELTVFYLKMTHLFVSIVLIHMNYNNHFAKNDSREGGRWLSMRLKEHC